MKSGIPVGKIARRLQVSPTLKTAKILHRRPNKPGTHGAKRSSTKSVYSKQLLEKQKLRFQFMISEKSLRRAYFVAQSMKGRTGENLVQLLDERLDAVVFRSGIVRSILASRQLVTHGHVFVNGRRVDKPSFRVSIKDEITLSEKARSFSIVTAGLSEAITVPYISLNRESVTIKREAQPPRAEIPVICNEQMVVEWYSR